MEETHWEQDGVVGAGLVIVVSPTELFTSDESLISPPPQPAKVMAQASVLILKSEFICMLVCSAEIIRIKLRLSYWD